MQPIPQSNTRQNERARKLHSSTTRHLKRSRVSNKRFTNCMVSSSHSYSAWKWLRTAWLTNQTVNFEEDTQRYHLGSMPRITATLPPPNWLTRSTTLSSNNRWEVVAEIQTVEQYSSTGSMNAQKYLATTAISLKTLIVFLKMPTLLEEEAAIALTCFSKINLKSRMTLKIYNSETISTTEPSIIKSENKDSTVQEWEISISLVLLGFTSVPHLLDQLQIMAKSSFNDAATDALSRGCGILQNRVESSA